MKYLTVLLVLFSVFLASCVVTEDSVTFRTADPNFSVMFTLVDPPPLPPVEPEVLPDEEIGVAEPVPPPTPPCLAIKGNISSSGEKIFHLPDGAYYDQVKIDESVGEAFFCLEEDAVAAGFRKASR